MTNFDTVKDYIENSYGDELGRSSVLEALEKLHAEIERRTYMKTYIVREERIVVIEYEVEACSEDEAEQYAAEKLKPSDGVEVDNYFHAMYISGEAV